MRNLILGVLIGLASAGVSAQRATPSFPDAPAADPAHYSVSFENDVARIMRVHYGPGEKSVMHRHFASCVYFITDQHFNMTLPDGTSDPSSVPAGSLGCGDGNVHQPQNIGPEAVDFIMFEFKNRDVFRK